MDRPIPPSAVEDLVTAAETYRAALVVRLAGEVGLRTAEIPRVRPCDLRESDHVTGAAILSVPASDEQQDTNDERIDREVFVPASVLTELRRYVDSADLDESEPFVDVSPRRVQMLVSETADRAATFADAPALSSITPRDLRHGFAKRLLNRGIDPHVVREAGGWGSMEALDPYLDPLDGEAIAEAVANGTGNTPGATAGDAEPSHHDAHRSISPPQNAWEPILDAVAVIPTITDRDDLFTAVVDRLTAGDRWRAVQIVRGTAGGALGDTDATEIVGDEVTDRSGLPSVPEGEQAPWRTAITEGEAVVRRIDNDGLVGEGANRPGAGSFLAVPVCHRDATYGALCLWSDVSESFGPTEREALSVLGRCLGWGVTAGRWQDLLHSDAVTRVEFRTTAGDAFFAAVSDTLGCRIELASTVTVSETSSRCYVRASAASPQALADAVAAARGVSELRVIETREAGCTVSIRVSGGSLVRTLTEHGATVRDAVAENGEVRVVADLPDGTEIGPIADGLRETYPDVRLVSKESVTRSPQSESTLREGVTERLTDRQWATLSAAFHSGYFDWPRGSTAEEVADAMDVSSPTFHNHLRKAQRALLETLFADD